MGYYIQVPKNLGKAKQIEELHDGMIIPRPVSFSKVPESKALIVVVNNGLFEAAGFAYDEKEFEAFTDPDDSRRKEYVLMDRKEAERLSEFPKKKEAING